MIYRKIVFHNKYRHLLVFAIFTVMHLVLSVLTLVPGYFVTDEVIYHLMTRDFVQSGGFVIDNGYEDFPSPELIPVRTVVHNGRLAPQYPYLFPVLNAPFYQLWGYRGLFLLNILAFPAIVALCYAIAVKLFDDRRLASTACLIFILATYSWEYSQGAWPHTTAILFSAAAFYLFLCAFFAGTNRTGLRWAVAAGLVAGFGMGIRLDIVFIIPCIMLPFLFGKPSPLQFSSREGAWLPECEREFPSWEGQGAFRGRFFRGEAAKFPSWEGQGVGNTGSEWHETPKPTPNPSQDGNNTHLPPSRGELAASPRKKLPLKDLRVGKSVTLLYVLATGIGTLPGLLLLSVTNYAKFGTFNPLSYGGSLNVTYYLPFLWLGVIGLVLFWCVTREPVVAYLRKNILLIMVGVFLLLMAGMMIPAVQHAFKRLGYGAAQMLLDLHVRNPYSYDPSLSLDHLVPPGHIRKSLLQSCPYLVILMLPILKMFHRKDRPESILHPPGPPQGGNLWKHRTHHSPLEGGAFLLLLIPAVFTGFYSFFAWTGGMCLNLRYLLPIFPYTSILAAYAWHDLTSDRKWQQVLYLAMWCGIFVMGYILVIRLADKSIDPLDFIDRLLPLIIAALLGCLIVIREIMIATKSRRGPGWVSSLVAAVFLVALLWAGWVAFGKDFPLQRRRRQSNARTAMIAAPLIEDNALLLTSEPETFFLMAESVPLYIGNPGNDQFQNFSRLVASALSRGRPVYGAFHPIQWDALQESGILDSQIYSAAPVKFFSNTILCRIKKQ